MHVSLHKTKVTATTTFKSKKKKLIKSNLSNSDNPFPPHLTSFVLHKTINNSLNLFSLRKTVDNLINSTMVEAMKAAFIRNY